MIWFQLKVEMELQLQLLSKKRIVKHLEKNTTQNFTITYKATLNNNAVLGQSGNTNRVIVTYQNDKDSKTITSKDTKVFTYGIDLTETG